MSDPALRRVVRRETHSPRTVAMFTALLVLILALAYIGTEIVLRLLSQPALLLGPAQGLAFLAGLPTSQPSGLVVVIGGAIALVGLVFVVLAVTPGRLSKHQMQWDGRAVVVDNGVVAAALAQHVSDETGLPRDRITVGVGHRRVDVTVRPGAGVPLDESRLRDIVEREVSDYRLTPSVKTSVRVARPTESEFDR
jgi:hypothetical protein